VECSCECGNELSGSIICMEVLERLHNWRPLEQCSAAYRERTDSDYLHASGKGSKTNVKEVDLAGSASSPV
jgi:hypothetical protein